MTPYKKIKWFMLTMIKRYNTHHVATTSAYMAYHWLLSFFPFLIFIISILTYTKLPTNIFMQYISKVMPATLVPVIESTVNQFVMYRSTTLISVGGLITLWSSGTAVNALIKGIHMAYNSQYMMSFIEARLMAMLYTVLLALLIIVLMVGVIFGNRVGNYLFTILDMNKGIFMPLWNIARLVMPFLAIISGVYIIYRFVPRKYLKIPIVWPGVIFTSVSWYIFSLIFSIYVDNYSKYSQLYGSIGSVFVLLIWLYGSCMLLVIGAEINALIESIKIQYK